MVDNHRLRAKIRRRKDEVSTTCIWCGREIFWLDRIPSKSVIKVTSSQIVVEINGFKKELLIATIDHYFERRYGGTSESRNLIPSCAPCNRSRSEESKSRPNVCVDCGKAKNNSSKRRCKVCLKQRKDEHFAKLGIENSSSQPSECVL